MVLGQESVTKKNRKATDRCSFSLKFIGSCLSSRTKEDDSPGPLYVSRKSAVDTNQTSTVAQASSSTASHGGSTTLSSPRCFEELNISSNLKKFSFNELRLSTRNFNAENILGEGGFGRVYKGWIDEYGAATVRTRTSVPVAVKTLNHDGVQGHKEWMAEVNYLGELLHPNLVKLIGCCIEDGQRLLVYEFMPRGSLENHLFRRTVPLPWSIRIKVALDAAKGLAFLHEEIDRPVIYRDFKTSNILLDADYNAKLSDFGLAKDGPVGDKTHVSTRVMGTQGYAAPEYVMTGHLTAKSDVYSFGVVLLELLTGKRSIDKNRPNEQKNLVNWARPLLGDKRRFYNIMDYRLEGQFSMKAAQTAIHMAARCLDHNPRARPLMSEIVEVLTSVLNLNDLACSTSYYRIMQAERMASSSNMRPGSRLQARPLPRNAQTPTRSMFRQNDMHTPSSSRNTPNQSPKPDTR